MRNKKMKLSLVAISIPLLFLMICTGCTRSSFGGSTPVGDNSKVDIVLSKRINHLGDILEWDVVGTVTAGAFVGDGSGLTGVSVGTTTPGLWEESGGAMNPILIANNVGVGTTTPGSKLTVVGDADVTGVYKIGNITVIDYDATDNNVSLGPNVITTTSPSGQGNILIGSNMGNVALSQDDNIGIGTNLYTLATGATNNIAIGNSAIGGLTLGDDNINLGNEGLIINQTGSDNINMGRRGLNLNVSGAGNINLGRDGSFGITGSRNIAIGTDNFFDAGNINDTITIGDNSGDTLVTGNRNMFLGAGVGSPQSTISNYMSIGNLIFSRGMDGVGSTVSTGNIGIGTNTPLTRLHVVGTVTATAFSGSGTGLTGIITGGTGKFVDGTNPLWAVYTTGNVGVGTVGPRAELEVNGNVALDALSTTMLLDSGGNSTGLQMTGGLGKVAIINQSGSIRFWTDDQATGNTFVASDEAMQISSSGIVAIGTTTLTQQLNVGGNVLADAFVGDGSLLTNVAGGAWTDTGTVVHLNNIPRNIGVGTTAPSSNQGFSNSFELLETGGTTGFDLMLTNPDAGTNEFLGQLSFNNLNDALAIIASKTDGFTDQGKIELNTQETGGIALVRMTIKGTGDIGIGTSTPATLLHVNGTATTGNLLVTGDCIMMLDSDGAGKTEITTLNGAMTPSQDTNGIDCDGI